VRTLLLDIETAPNKVYTWGMWDQNIGTNQVIGSGYILCWAAKWKGEKKMMFDSVEKSKPVQMLGRIHKLLDEAQAVVHYNGTKFDIPTLNKEFIKNGFKPPAPYKQIDLLRVCKYAFRFESNKLDYVSQALSIGAKVRHEGFELWVKCMENDPAAWKRMEKYNRHDVKLLETLYNRLVPWMDRHPNVAAHADVAGCPKCGSENYQQRGHALTNMMKYRRYQCNNCGGWFRGNKSVSIRIKERMANIAA
jgi:DNA polymerase elongation subunit (family B)